MWQAVDDLHVDAGTGGCARRLRRHPARQRVRCRRVGSPCSSSTRRPRGSSICCAASAGISTADPTARRVDVADGLSDLDTRSSGSAGRCCSASCRRPRCGVRPGDVAGGVARWRWCSPSPRFSLAVRRGDGDVVLRHRSRSGDRGGAVEPARGSRRGRGKVVVGAAPIGEAGLGLRRWRRSRSACTDFAALALALYIPVVRRARSSPGRGGSPGRYGRGLMVVVFGALAVLADHGSLPFDRCRRRACCWSRWRSGLRSLPPPLSRRSTSTSAVDRSAGSSRSASSPGGDRRRPRSRGRGVGRRVVPDARPHRSPR